MYFDVNLETLRSLSQSRIFRILLVLVAFGSLFLLVPRIASSRNITTALTIIVGLAATVVILQKPYVGLTLVMALVSLNSALSDSLTIGYMNLALGGVTVAAFFIQRRWGKEEVQPLRFTAVQWFGVFFIGWIFVSNPTSAFGIGSDRNWLLTFVQLFVLLWLGPYMLTTPERNRVFMAVFVAAALFSGLSAVGDSLTTPLSTDPTYSAAAGLAGQSNVATRLFTYGFIFLYYLRSTLKSSVVSLLGGVGLILLGFAVVTTLSRTGVLLLILALLLLVLKDLNSRRGRGIVVLLLSGIIIFSVVPNTLFTQLTDRFTADNGDVTAEKRYWLWLAGLDMFRAHPIQGVGIGNFANDIVYYSYLYSALTAGSEVGAHNIYIAVLAETGMVGSFFFGGMIVTALRGYWRGIRTLPPDQSAILKIWLIVSIVILIGGLTKHDQYDKMLWLTLGMSGCFAIPKVVPTQASHPPSTKLLARTTPADGHQDEMHLDAG